MKLCSKLGLHCLSGMMTMKTVISPLAKCPMGQEGYLNTGIKMSKPAENCQSVSISWNWTWNEKLQWESTNAGEDSEKLAFKKISKNNCERRRRRYSRIKGI